MGATEAWTAFETHAPAQAMPNPTPADRKSRLETGLEVFVMFILSTSVWIVTATTSRPAAIYAKITKSTAKGRRLFSLCPIATRTMRRFVCSSSHQDCMKPFTLLALTAVAFAPSLRAELKLSAIIADHMVLQQKQSDPIWGWDTPGTTVTVHFADQSKTAEAGQDGRWSVKLDPMNANAKPQTMTISGTSKKEIQDILIGEVWMCSGQSNMGFQLQSDWNGDIQSAASTLPNLRLLKVPNKGTQDLQSDFRGEWKASTPETSKPFTAVGFFFGRYLHQILGVPVGLIDNSWGGSAAEAWIRRETIEKDPHFKLLMEGTRQHEAYAATPKAKTDYEAQLAKWKTDLEAAKAAGKPAQQWPRQPQPPEAWLTGNARPGNIFAGVVNPTLGYGMKGVIWYQGESNAGRAYEYRELFPFMIQQWRKEWKQGDFPFHWVQLADYMAEKPEPSDSAWAELREAQTRTMSLPNSGQAVIIDLGEANDIHPKHKHDVAARLVRWALVKDYGQKFFYRSPEFKSMQIEGNKATLTIDCFGSGLRTVDVNEVKGFAICGEDKHFYWAKAEIKGNDQVVISSDKVSAPTAVRYAWADNPVCNLYSRDGLPVTPFRTDDFEMITKPKPVVAPATAKPASSSAKPAASAQPAAKPEAAPKKAA
jgi:sialate O-acetylesterase